ncbi:ATP-binding protein, partial [Simkania negevensis]|nr:ATP-binding protein [Simkania negevensis]
LRTLKLVRYDAGNLYLEALDSFQALWFEEHVLPQAKEGLFNNNNRKIKIHLSVMGRPLPSRPVPENQTPVQVSKEKRKDDWPLSYTFENWIPSKENEFTLKLFTKTVGWKPEGEKWEQATINPSSFNPLYVYGPTGSGKTHLLIATAHALKKQGYRCVYVRGETFTEDMVNAIRSGFMDSFRKRYREPDVLIIDDVEVFSNKKATQEELFHTFNELHIEEKQIILSGACAPQELKAVEPRLISRFEWGVLATLVPLKDEGLRSALNTKIEELNLSLQKNVIDFLLSRLGSNPQELSQAVEALSLRLHLNSTAGRAPMLPLHLDVASSYLSDLLDKKNEQMMTPEKIVTKTASHFGISAADVTGDRQTRECSMPRKIAMYLCRKELGMPYTHIGEIFNRDHSTVMSNVHQIEKKLKSKDPDTSSVIKQLGNRS